MSNIPQKKVTRQNQSKDTHSTDTIRTQLVDAINTLNHLLEVCDNVNDRFEIRLKIRELFHRLDRVIIASLDPKTTEFDDALMSLKALSTQAKTSKKNLDKVAITIAKAADAINKVEKLVKNVSGVLPII